MSGLMISRIDSALGLWLIPTQSTVERVASISARIPSGKTGRPGPLLT